MTFLAMTSMQTAALVFGTAAAVLALYFLKVRRRTVLVSSAILFLVMVVVFGAIMLGFAQALGFFWRILTDG